MGGQPVNATFTGVPGRLDAHRRVLAAALGTWQARDDSRPQPAVREAAGTALGAIDAMLAELHAARSVLAAEARRSDAAAAARADAMLAGREDGAP
jgi:hypothetical protein